jgi:hypothetical protein
MSQSHWVDDVFPVRTETRPLLIAARAVAIEITCRGTPDFAMTLGLASWPT